MKNIVRRLKKKIWNYLNFDNKIRVVEKLIVRESNIQKMLLGHILVENLLKKGDLENIHEAEFKVFSQWGDDGIIQYLINKIDTPKTFVDIGAGTYTQPDTRFLLEHDNWSGIAIDASSVDPLKNSELYPCYDITAKQEFITAENVNELIDFEEVGLLNIDIDGNDYWIWKALKISPIIVIVEYNPYFGLKPITVPYNKDFKRNVAHHSSMYYGASLMSLCDLAKEKGYVFIGCNSNGGNAYFIRKDKVGKLKVLTPQEGYRETKSREHRDKNGNLTFTAPQKAKESLKGMPVFNTQKGKIETL
ncbi:MAG: hypothetical protein A2741_00230 [Candidatus Zambryskibacteria bacterium RIFCSPHIGHO2_01_FULL_43_27]|nr:MAG: hypothetical protein A2741_00230 [Candidatus Zambryskibacteria bacterium RIFCSPHIGHO2_01_FULL_43_27]